MRLTRWIVVAVAAGALLDRQRRFEEQLAKRQHEFERAVELAIRSWARRTAKEIERAMEASR